MCGITGFIAPAAQPLSRYLRAHSLLAHRGPDDEGFVMSTADGVQSYRGAHTVPAFRHLPSLDPSLAGHWALGHHRLSIVDLSPSGHQPMVLADRYWIVFNGEIYNFIELRRNLEALGHIFRSQSDTEVILHAFDQWGADCFNRFNGMWAIALFDTQEQCLWLSRDRAGVKPLYWTISNQVLYFASELKFMRHVLDTPRLEETLAADFLATSRTDHREKSFICDVFALTPGHYLTIRPHTLTPEMRPYWQLPDISTTTDLSYGQALEEFRDLLNSAIDLRMRSDVPVGSLLSGGIDSTVIATNLASRGKTPASGFHSYSSVYKEDQYSERAYIEQTILRYPAIRAHYVIPDPLQIPADMSDLLETQDGPVRSMAVYAQYCLYRTIAQQGIVKVLLNGQGADELFAGYGNYRYAWAAEALPHIAMATRRLPASAKHSAQELWHAWRWILSLRYRKQTSKIDAPVHVAHVPLDPVRKAGTHILRRELRHSLQFSALPEYLRYEDRNSMRFGLESRLPFLDYRLVEFAARLPSEWLLTSDKTKVILRDCAASYATAAVLARTDKMGFVTPQEKWQRHELRDFMLSHLADCNFSFVNRSQWLNWLPRYAENFDSHRFAWRAVSLHLWMQQWGF